MAHETDRTARGVQMRRQEWEDGFSLVEVTEAEEQFDRKARYAYAAVFWCFLLMVLGLLAVAVVEWAAGMGWV